jgi:hypothetical protein
MDILSGILAKHPFQLIVSIMRIKEEIMGSRPNPSPHLPKLFEALTRCHMTIENQSLTRHPYLLTVIKSRQNQAEIKVLPKLHRHTAGGQISKITVMENFLITFILYPPVKTATWLLRVPLQRGSQLPMT